MSWELCEHGSQKHKCNACSDAEEIASLRAALALCVSALEKAEGMNRNVHDRPDNSSGYSSPDFRDALANAREVLGGGK